MSDLQLTSRVRLECGHEIVTNATANLWRPKQCPDGCGEPQWNGTPRKTRVDAILVGDVWVERKQQKPPRSMSVPCGTQRRLCEIYGHKEPEYVAEILGDDRPERIKRIMNRNPVHCICGEPCEPGQAERQWCKKHKHTYWCKLASR